MIYIGYTSIQNADLFGASVHHHVGYYILYTGYAMIASIRQISMTAYK